MIEPGTAKSAAVAADLWLMGQAPRPCSIAKLASNNLIFISLHQIPAPGALGASPTDPADLMIEGGQGGNRLRIRTRICEQTRERWILEPLDSNLDRLPELAAVLSHGAPAVAGRGETAQAAATHRADIIRDCSRILADYLSNRYGRFYTALDDALVMAATTAAEQAGLLDAITELGRAHHQLEHSVIERACWLTKAAAEPDFEPIAANYAAAVDDIEAVLDGDAPLSLERLATACGERHAAALDNLCQRFSSTIHRLCDQGTLPFGPPWLCHHFNDAINAFALEPEALQVVYRVFRDTVLRDLDALYQQLNRLFANYAVLPELQAGMEWLDSQDQADSISAPTEAGDLGGTGPTTRSCTGELWLAALGQQLACNGARARAIGPKVLAQRAKQWLPEASYPLQNRETAARITLLHQLLEQLGNHERIATDAHPLLAKLEPAIAHLCLEQNAFFQQRDHAAREAIDLVAWLCAEARFHNGPVRRQLEAICDRLARQGMRNAAVFEAVLPPLRTLVQRQQAAAARNRQRVAAMQQSQYQFHRAQQDVEKQLYQRYAAAPFPRILLELLDAGWRKYLIHLRLKQDRQGQSWHQSLAVLHGLYCALVGPEQRSTDASRYVAGPFTPLRQHLVEPLEALGICSAAYETVAQQLASELKQAQPGAQLAGYPAAASDLAAQAKGEPPPARWYRLCEDLRAGDWLGWLDNPQDEPLQLAWIAADYSRFVFVNDSGHRLDEWTRDELAAHLGNGLQPVTDPGTWSPLDDILFDLANAQHRALVRAAAEDPVTGALNRQGIAARLAELAKLARYSQAEHTLLGLEITSDIVTGDDMDPTRRDQLVRHCAEQARQHFPAPAILGRCGDNRFYILVPYQGAVACKNPADALAGALAADPQLPGCRFNLAMLTVNADSSSNATLFQQLDSLLYQASRSLDRGVVLRHGDETERERQVMLGWVTELGEILQHDRLRLRCQAITPLGDGEARHEILLGVENEDGSVTPPGELIAAAERYQRMDIIDRWVIQHVLAWLHEEPSSAIALGPLHINLSGNSVGNDLFLNYLLAALDRDILPRGHLCFEISEQAATINLPRAADFMARLRNLGCKVALDNFGNSPASFDYLRKMPVDYLKIDGALVNAAAASPHLLNRLDAINRIAHFSGIETIANCVESEGELARMEQLGIDYAQGFGIAKPTLLSEA